MVATKLIGGFLILEAIASMMYSEDKRGVSQVGRLVKIGVGTYVYNIE